MSLCPPPSLKRIEKKLGRPLRVLHISNIANNAYTNSKLMRQIGIESDVLCPDYYHIMACPEWEDANLHRIPVDESRPVWSKVDLRGFKRPSWFYQGPERLLFLCLKFKWKGNRLKYYWLKKTLYRVCYQQPPMLFRLIKVRNKITEKVEHAIEKLKVKESTKKKLKAGNGKIFYLISVHSFYFILRLFFFITGKTRENPFIVKRKKQNPAEYTTIEKYYDIIQGYGLGGKYPLIAQNPAWCAYEHGTIRDIPFEDTDQGKLCRNIYQTAPVVFITNSDCLEAAEKLNIPSERIYPIPHAFDSHKAAAFRKKWKKALSTHSVPTFFAPARHHWRNGFKTWLKGNDQIIYAFSQLNRLGKEFKLIFVEWGQEVSLSKELIRDEGLEEKVQWVSPMTKAELWKQYLQSDMIIDQLVLPALGSVGFETLSMGKPLISHIDELVLEKFFGVPPPLINVKNAQDIVDACLPLFENREFYKDLGEKASLWIDHYHSSERIIDIQLKAYEKLLGVSQENA